MRALFGCSLTVLLVAGCGGGNDSSETQPNIDYSALRELDPQESLLAPGSEATLGSLLKNGVRLSLRDSQLVNAAPLPAASQSGLTPSGAYSGTTVQVEGVDEGDRVKYDGRHIYALTTQSGGFPALPIVPVGLSIAPEFASELRIVATNPQSATTNLISATKLDWTNGSQPTLYRVDGVTTRTQYAAVVGQAYGHWLSSPVLPPAPNRVVLDLFEVSAPAQVSRAWKIEIEGWLRASRQIGDTLYVVTGFYPSLRGLALPARSDDERRSNERIVANAALADLLPHVVEAGVERPLVSASQCLVPANVANDDAYRELIVVAAINLREQRIADVECLGSKDQGIGASGVYMSASSLYVGSVSLRLANGAATRTKATVLHKFALQNGLLEYRAVGAVDGAVGWINSSYFMDERQNDLRIVTTQISPDVVSRPVHRLHVLREDGQRLALLSTLPNPAFPEPIGKPGESIRGVRFDAARAYVVTFRNIDPLYVIDLADHASPRIAGQLEIPGFSTYLRPLGSGYLLGIGQAADANGIAQGIKVELFDIRNMAQPRSVGAQVFGGAWSDALWDPHALTFLTLPDATTPGAQRYRMAVHLDVFATPTNTWSYSGLHLFEVSGLQSGAAQLHFQGVLAAQDSSNGVRRFESPTRGVLHDDAVFYMHGSDVTSRLWRNVVR